MQKKMSLSFHDQILRIITIHTLLPLFLVIAAVFIFSIISFDRGVLAENRNDNELIGQELTTLFTLYSTALNSSVLTFDVHSIKNDSNAVSAFLTMMIQFMNRQGNMADFYLFDESYACIISSAGLSPVFMPPKAGKNWGLVHKMNHRPEEVHCVFSHGNLLIGKRIQNGYAVFSIPESFFQTQLFEKQSMIIVSNEYNEAYTASSALFLKSFNILRTEAVSADSFFKFNNQWYFKKISNHIIGDNKIRIYTISAIKRILITLICEGCILFFLIILSGFISCNAAVKTINKKTAAIDTIVACLAEVQKGNFSSYMNIEADNEFAIIADSYNIMIGSIGSLIQKNKEIMKETVSAQIKQLESQFNPHFLFNTLENIKYMVQLEPHSIPVIINNLSELLRYSISISESNVSLAEDLKYTENYLSIQKFRFRTSLTYLIDIAPETKNCIVPKLLIQPLIENSIVHGYGTGQKRQLAITVRTHIRDGKLCVYVTDNGMGMNEGQTCELRTILEQNRRTVKHFGLYNIRRRLTLLYGSMADFTIESSAGKGTTVGLSFPAIFKEAGRVQSIDC